MVNVQHLSLFKCLTNKTTHNEIYNMLDLLTHRNLILDH